MVATFLIAATSCDVASPPPIVAHVAKPGAQPWLFVSDLHFDPFDDDPVLTESLAAAPPERWAAIYAREVALRDPGVLADPNSSLFRSSLEAMHEADPNPPVVIIAGDFLAHHFFRLYANARFGHIDLKHSGPDYDRFMDATIAYIALAFDREFPHARFFVTIGNNDGYCGDYESTPGSPFLANFARAWSPLVDRYGDQPDFAKSFPAFGAYVGRLPLEGDRRLLVPNSVIWSLYYSDPCEPGRRAHDGHAQAVQLAWMRRVTARGGASTRWWMMTHIPPGINAFGSTAEQTPRSMYASSALDQLQHLRLSGGRPFQLIVTGHTHANSFRLTPHAGGPGVAPVTIIPSITPVNGNAPAFAVDDILPDGSVADVTVYSAAQPLRGGRPLWHEAYDFDAAFGVARFDADTIRTARTALEDDAGCVDGTTPASWRRAASPGRSISPRGETNGVRSTTSTSRPTAGVWTLCDADDAFAARVTLRRRAALRRAPERERSPRPARHPARAVRRAGRTTSGR